MPLTYQCSNVALQGNNTSHISATLGATNQICYGCETKNATLPLDAHVLARDSVMW